MAVWDTITSRATNITGSEGVNIFARDDGGIANYTLDAVLEESLEMSVETPSYPIESGASVSDHRIIQPIKYQIRGVVSNTPLKVSVFDFAGGLVSNLTENPIVAAAAGISAGALAGQKENRAQAALAQFIQILEGEKPFDVVSGDISLKNMVITKITRTRNPENENALVFDLDLTEFISLDRLTSDGQPDHRYLRDGDPSKAGNAREVSKGQATLKDASTASQTEAASVMA